MSLNRMPGLGKSAMLRILEAANASASRGITRSGGLLVLSARLS